MKPIRASIGFSRGNTLVSKLIRRLDGGVYNHVYWRFDFEPSGSLIYESHIRGGVQITPYQGLLSAMLKHKKGEPPKVAEIEEYDTGLNPGQCCDLYNLCAAEHGDHYNTMQIVRYYLWIRLGDRRETSWINKMSNRYTCNQLVVKTGREVIPEMKGLDYSFTIRPLRELAKYCFTPLSE